jgi:hypothetical protein
MPDQPTNVIGDTGATGNQPGILTPVAVPDIQPGALSSTIPPVLTSLLPLWVGNVPAVWQQMGLAVPGCGGRLRTGHPGVEYLYSRVAEHTQAVMFHPCARLDRWPEMDVLRVMHDCYINARDLLNSALVPDAAVRPRATISGAQSIPFKCYPMPFYGNYVRNAQIALWAKRNMEFMTLLMLSDENSFTYGFSQIFVNQVAVPLRENYRWMLINLLKVPVEKVTETYVALEADFTAYAAAKVSVDRNLINNQGSIDPLWTPSPNDKAWTVGAYTYLEAAPLMRIWPETAAPAVATDDRAAGLQAAQGGINTT